jgi:hypothetical protein
MVDPKKLVKPSKKKHGGVKNSQFKTGVVQEQGRTLVLDYGPNSDSRGYTRLERAITKAPPKKPVHHKDTNPKNNSPGNLKVEPSAGAHNKERAGTHYQKRTVKKKK